MSKLVETYSRFILASALPACTMHIVESRGSCFRHMARPIVVEWLESASGTVGTKVRPDFARRIVRATIAARGRIASAIAAGTVLCILASCRTKPRTGAMQSLQLTARDACANRLRDPVRGRHSARHRLAPARLGPSLCTGVVPRADEHADRCRLLRGCSHHRHRFIRASQASGGTSVKSATAVIVIRLSCARSPVRTADFVPSIVRQPIVHPE